MIRLTVASLAAFAAVVLPATAAHADDTTTADLVQACLTAHPGAVTADAVTPGDDTVCIADGQVLNGSEGNDTYLWQTDNPATANLGGGLGPWSSGAGTTTRDGYNDPGNDTLSLADWPGAYNDASMWNGRVTSVDGVQIETIVLTPFADAFNPTLTGDCGLTENNDHTLVTGDGPDLVNCVAGNIVTGEGGDTVHGASFDSTITTGPGADTVSNIDVHTTVNTGADDDTVTNVLGDSRVATDDGNDQITDVAASTVTAGAGDDVIDTVTDASTIYAGTGNDTITNADASTIFAQGGADTVAGVPGSDTFSLGAGADTAYVTGGGADTVKGGMGTDTVYASGNDTVRSALVK